MHRIDGGVLNSICHKRFPALSREVTQGGNGAQGNAEARMQISKKSLGEGGGKRHFLVVEMVNVVSCKTERQRLRVQDPAREG